MKLGTDVHHTKQVNLAIMPSQISPLWSVGAIYKNCRYVTISQKLRCLESSLPTPYTFSGAYISEKVLPNMSSHCIRHFGRHIKQFSHFQRNTSISETKSSSISTLYLGFVWRRLKTSIAEYILSLYQTFSRPFKKNCGHFQSNTSILETKRCKALHFDYMHRF